MAPSISLLMSHYDRILEEISSTFVVNLRFAFQDEEHYMYMAIDLMTGGDLRFLIDQHGRYFLLSQQLAYLVIFYIAELSCSLSTLHSRGIIHRDIKSDNVLLDEAGHAYLTDFNISCHLNPLKLPTAVCGTMPYMAPEVILKNGYNTSIDWWSLGVLAYELVTGKRPFKSGARDELINLILTLDVKAQGLAKRIYLEVRT
jgi:serine/threonine kinase 32